MLRKIEFAAGYVKDDTPLASEGGYIDGDKVRFRQGKPELIGGWAQVSSSSFTGIARSCHAWSMLDGTPCLAWGTASKLYCRIGSTVTDITPSYYAEGTLYQTYNGTISKTANYTLTADDNGKLVDCTSGTFNVTLPTHATDDIGTRYTIRNSGAGVISILVGGATNTPNVINYATTTQTLNPGEIATIEQTDTFYDPTNANRKTANWTYELITSLGYASVFSTTNTSPIVTVYHPEHGLIAGQSITFSNCTAQGGITISGSYTVTTVLSRDKYTITHGSNASSTTTSSTDGQRADYQAAWTSGNVDGSSSLTPTVWHLDNFGETLLACRAGGPLYQFQPASSYPALIANQASSANAFTGSSTAGWSYATTAGGTYTAVAGTNSIIYYSLNGTVKGGYTYRLTFTATRSAGAFRVRVYAGDPEAFISVGEVSADIVKSGTYSMLITMPDKPAKIAFEKDTLFAGTIVAPALVLEDNAFLIKEAPRHIDVMWVDPSRLVVCGGTFEADGDYNPTLLRWSDVENIRTWVPDDNNVAGELALSHGSKIVCGKTSLGQTLVATDQAIYTSQFTGDTSNPFAVRQLGFGSSPISSHSVAEHNGALYWWGANGNFYVFQGGIPQIIDCRLKVDAFTHIAQYQNEKINTYVNTTYNEIWFFYPDSRDSSGANVECSRVVVYNFAENHFTTHSFARSCGIDSDMYQYPILMGTDSTLYYHEDGTNANGSSLTGYLETAYFDVEDGGNLMMMRRIVPDFNNQSGDLTFTVYGKRFPQHSTTLTFGPFTSSTTTEMINFRAIVRQMKIRIDSSANPSAWRLGALRVDADKSGDMR